jgi:hypothetical protein
MILGLPRAHHTTIDATHSIRATKLELSLVFEQAKVALRGAASALWRCRWH